MCFSSFLPISDPFWPNMSQSNVSQGPLRGSQCVHRCHTGYPSHQRDVVYPYLSLNGSETVRKMSEKWAKKAIIGPTGPRVKVTKKLI